MVPGTSTIRTSVASTRTATARPSPTIVTTGSGWATKAPKTAIMMRAAAVMTRAMLEGGDDGLAIVARRTGFGSVESLRRAFVREVGVSPGAYRSQFRTTGISGDRVTDIWPETVHRVPVSPPA